MNFPENCRTRQSIPCHVTGNRSFPDAQALPEFMARDAFFFQPILQFHEATIPIGKNLSTKRVPLRMIFRLRPRFRYDNLTFRMASGAFLRAPRVERIILRDGGSHLHPRTLGARVIIQTGNSMPTPTNRQQAQYSYHERLARGFREAHQHYLLRIAGRRRRNFALAVQVRLGLAKSFGEAKEALMGNVAASLCPDLPSESADLDRRIAE